MEYKNYTGRTIFRAWTADGDTLPSIERIPSIGEVIIVRPKENTEGIEFKVLPATFSMDLPVLTGTKYIVSHDVWSHTNRNDFVTASGMEGYTKQYKVEEIKGLLDNGVFTDAENLDLSTVEGKSFVYHKGVTTYFLLAFEKLLAH